MKTLSLFLVSLLFAQNSNASSQVELKSPQCKPGEHYVRAHHRNAYTKANGVHYSESNVTAHCQENSKAYTFLSPKFRDKLPLNWPNKSEKSKPWTEAEKQRIMEALSALPEALWSPNLFSIVRGTKSVYPGNLASSHNNTCVFYDEAFNGMVPLEQVLSHEMAHLIFKTMPEQDRVSYRNATGWHSFDSIDRNTEPMLIRRECCFVEPDGSISSEEDFANNIEYFLFKPTNLKDKTENAYSWIKNKYGDKFIKGAK